MLAAESQVTFFFYLLVVKTQAVILVLTLDFNTSKGNRVLALSNLSVTSLEIAQKN